MVFAYIYQASRLTKTVVIIGIFIIIGLSLRDWNYTEPDKKSLDSKYEGTKFTKNDIGKKLRQHGELDNIRLAQTDKSEDNVNECADICLNSSKCVGFNYHGNKCAFIAGDGLKQPELVEAENYISFSKL